MSQIGGYLRHAVLGCHGVACSELWKELLRRNFCTAERGRRFTVPRPLGGDCYPRLTDTCLLDNMAVTRDGEEVTGGAWHLKQ